MKKLLVLVLVGMISTLANAGVITVNVAAGDATVGNKYNPGQLITVQLVASGFGLEVGSGSELSQFTISTITDTGAGAASTISTNSILNAAFDQVKVKGTLVGTGGVLIRDITGAVGFDDGANADFVANGDVVYSFKFTTGAVAGTYAIGITGLTTAETFGELFTSSVSPLSYTVTPEPVTVALLGLGGLFIRRRKVA